VAISEFTTPETVFEGVDWPALPGPKVLPAFAVLFQLERSQWLRPEALLRNQLRQAAALVAHAAAEVPFYRNRLAAVAGRDTIDIEAWRALPILTRADIQEAGNELAARALPQGHGQRHVVATSGALGRPIRIESTETAAQVGTAIRLRANRWHGRDYAGKVAVIERLSAESRRLAQSGEYVPWAPGYRTGPLRYRDIVGTIDDHLAWLRAEDPDYLIACPTVARALAERSLETGKKPIRLREVDTTGETLDPALRELCRRAWSTPVVDIYNARETGVLAIQCPAAEHYHVQGEAALVEIVDEAGRPCAPGEVGRVVATPLHNYAMPLIRYHPGDYAEAGEECPCGRGLPVIRRVLGRTRNLALLPDGQRVVPSIDGMELSQVPPLRQFQIVQRSASELEATLVATRPLNASEESRLRAAVTRGFGHPFALRIAYAREIPLSPGKAFEQFRVEIASLL
jgi:phenylacetate-CoA ligase